MQRAEQNSARLCFICPRPLLPFATVLSPPPFTTVGMDALRGMVSCNILIFNLS